MIATSRGEMFRRSGNRLRSGMRGAGFVKVLLIIPGVLILLVLLAMGFFEGRKAYWDYQVRGMCEKDGGVKVYERAPLPQKYFDRDGHIRIPFDAHATAGDEYFLRTIRTSIVDGHLSVVKHQTQLFRSAVSARV
jgi:hypothetical protein